MAEQPKINPRSEALRAWADENNTFCVFATVHEIAGLLDELSSVPTPEEALSLYQQTVGQEGRGALSPQHFFSVLDRYSEGLGISIDEVIANPSFIDKFDVPEAIKGKLHVATGVQKVGYPHMRVLAKKINDHWITHAETDDRTPRTQQRIQPMEQNGWRTGMVVQFKKS